MNRPFERTSRRAFLARATSTLGAIALSRLAGAQPASAAHANASGSKKLLATTDYYCNVGGSQCLFDRKQMDGLHRYLASLGVARHQWIVDTIWDLYDGDRSGYDILAEAADSAHRHGIEFYAEIKPFEGGGFGDIFPSTLPFPEGVIALRDMRGIYPRARAFVARHPHLCLKRKPGTYEARGPVKAIRLVKGDDQPTRVKAEHLSLWTSPSNNHFARYEGPVTFRESVEWRPAFPKTRLCRILHLEGLDVPEDHRYLLIRCSLAGEDGDFTNERGNLIELVGPDDAEAPCILSTGPVEYGEHRQRYLDGPLYKRLVSYFRLPEVERELYDETRARGHYRDFYSFMEHRKVTELYTLDKEGFVGIALGKPEYMLGNLHPIYAEVREHWLDLIRYCLDRGVDGINIRHSNHTQSPEDWDYGFNEPVLEATGGDLSYPAIRRVNGDAYTQFLREARDLVKSRDKSLTIHLYAQMLAPDDRPTRLNYIPPNFEWQWETWVKEIADDLELRGTWTLHPWNLRQVLDTFSAVTHAAGKPFYFQGNMKELRFDGPLEFTRREIDMINDEPNVDGFVLYETANFTRMNEAGEIVGSPDVSEVISSHFRAGRS